MSVSRAYPNAISTMPADYIDYENAHLEWQYDHLFCLFNYIVIKIAIK